MADVLILEDDPAQREGLVEYLTDTVPDHKIHASETVEAARQVLHNHSVDLVISDMVLPDGTGLELLKESDNPDTSFLILTAQPTLESAVEAIRAGANDYLSKPVDLTLLKKKVLSLLETGALRRENKLLKARIEGDFGTRGIVGNSRELKDVIEKAAQIAATDVTVLIEGESGTGKERLANYIHQTSKRSNKPFIKVNCGALTKSILESELFGSVKGAFTGADRDREGLFEAADGGTIFLDEVGEMDLESQVRLLRVIEEKEVMRVGSTKPIPVNVRIITATNKNLLEESDTGRFREDLYYRLAVIKLTLPPLRRRREDIPLLFNHFVTEFNEKYGKSVTGLSDELMQFCQNYSWPGNIRQFRNVLEGMVVLAQDDILQYNELPEEIRNMPVKKGNLVDEVKPGITLDDYEKAIIEKNLSFHMGNREKTAETLGISERTLYRKINLYGLS